MALSDAGQWLENALQKLCVDGGSDQLDADLLFSLVSYCEMAPPADAKEYILNIVGDERCKHIVTEYLQRRGTSMGTEDLPANITMKAYQKPREIEDTWSTGIKKPVKSKNGGSGPGGFPVQGSDKMPTERSAAASTSQKVDNQKAKRGFNKGKKGGKGISLAEAAEGLVVFPKNAPCNCQAARHKLINNCLSCGKIVCEQEGEGPCNFCGALVLKEGSEYAGLEGVPVPLASEAESVAREFKNRLVEYDRTSASRTTVIDDQSDYFNIEGNTWLSQKEKKMLQDRQEEESRAAVERRKRVTVTVDLLGRKVIMADEFKDTRLPESSSIPGRENFLANGSAQSNRIQPNPLFLESPVYVDITKSSGPSVVGKTKQRLSSKSWMLQSGRIQHDEAVLGNEDLSSNTWSDWQTPSVCETLLDKEEEECLVECKTVGMGELWQDSVASNRGNIQNNTTNLSGARLDENNNSKSSTYMYGIAEPPVFDICRQPAAGRQHVLATSSLVQKQMERREAGRDDLQRSQVLHPGMVILKHWLSSDAQVEIVKGCRDLGIGLGGFYQPSYNESSRMHLHMMCLGMHWEPTTQSYGPRRPCHDNAAAPPIPKSFIKLVQQALSAAQTLSSGKAGMGSHGKEHSLPSMNPNICIVNFYEHSGNLGMHQDKDESPASLQRGTPVVSFSVGDSADFVYGRQRDLEKADKVVLESGDVLVFGGFSRMIFHGVTQVHRGTAPQWLRQRTNVQPGRLNLTFREF